MSKNLTWVEQTKTFKVLDIPSMSHLSDSDYRERVGDLLYVDVALRVRATDHPIAATSEQLDILIEELQKLKYRIAPKDNWV